ncbi:Hypothetical protein, putative, partial [Bodo saltans]
IDANSSSIVTTPSIVNLMHVSRWRKFSRVQVEILQFKHIVEREEQERAWLIGWWLLWQRLVSQYIEVGARFTTVNHQMSVPRSHHRLRQRTLRKDLARSLEKLSRKTHLAQRFMSWRQCHMMSREENIMETLRNAELAKRMKGGETTQDLTSDAHSPGSKQLNTSNITTTTTASDASTRTPTRFRGYAIEDPWSPSTNHNNNSAGQQHHLSSAVPPTRPSSTSDSRTASASYGHHHPPTAKYVDISSMDANGLSASSAHDSQLTSSAGVSPQYHHRQASDNSDHSSVSVLGTTTTTTMVAGPQYHGNQQREFVSTESIVIDAVMTYSSDLVVRHLNKLCKIAQREESARRNEIVLQAVAFTDSRNIELAWILSKLHAESLLRMFSSAAIEFQESAIRQEIALMESSEVIDLIVEHRLERHALNSTISKNSGVESLISRGATSSEQLAGVPITAVSSCGVVLVTSPPGSPLVNFSLPTPEDSVLQASPHPTAPPALVYQLPPKLKLLPTNLVEEQAFLLQRIGRAYSARQNTFRHVMFWKVDRGIRKELWTAFTQGLMVLAGKLAGVIATSSGKQSEEKTAKQEQQQSAISVIQRVCRGSKARSNIKFVQGFWIADHNVRVELFDAWQKKVGRIESLSRLHVSEINERFAVCRQENATRVQLETERCLSTTIKRAVSCVQKVSRAFVARKHLYRLRCFWEIDTRIRKEVYNAWITKAETLERAAARNLLRMSEKQVRLAIDTSEAAAFKSIFALAQPALLLSASAQQQRALAVLCLQRCGRGHIARNQRKGMHLFWVADTNIRGEALEAWQAHVHRIMHFCTTSYRLMFVEETASRAPIEHDQAQERSNLMTSASLVISHQILVETSTSLYASALHAREVSLKQFGELATFEHLLIRTALDEFFERTTVEVDAYNLSDFSEKLKLECPKPREIVARGATEEENSDADVSSDEEDHNNASGKDPRNLSTTVAAVSLEPHGFPNKTSDNSDAEVSSDDDGDDDGIKDKKTSDESVDVSSEDSKERRSVKKMSCTQDEEEDVDVSSDEDDRFPKEVRANQVRRTEEQQQQQQQALPEVPQPSHPQSDGGSTVVVASSEDDEEDDDDVDVSDDDDDADHSDLALSGMVEMLMRMEAAMRQQFQENEAQERVVLKKHHTAELSAIEEGDDDDDSDDDGSFHIESPQANVDLHTPAKSNNTHRPQSILKRRVPRASSAGAKPKKNLSLSQSMQSGELQKSTSSSVTLLLRHSTSGGQPDDSVELLSDDESIDVTSDDSSSADDSGPIAPPAPIAPAKSWVRDTYTRIFANQRSTLEGAEYAARYEILQELFKLQHSLLSAQEYLMRHSTVIVNRNAFARNMLTTKQKMEDMVKMQLRRGNSLLNAANVVSSQRPPPRGSLTRTRSNSSDFSLNSTLASPDSIASRSNSMAIGNASVTSILREAQS